MKKIGIFATFTILLLLCTVSLGQEQAPAPMYQDGDWWQFRVTNRDYITSYSARLGSGMYKLSVENGKFIVSDSEGNKVTATIASTGSLESMTGSPNALKRRFLDFPLSAGKKWNSGYQATVTGGERTRGDTSQMRVDVRVVGTEKVAVPAGTFQTFKIERDDVGGPRWHWKWIYYYSPETKSIVKFFFDSLPGVVAGQTEVELVKFGSASQ